jgi:hypothetical protein
MCCNVIVSLTNYHIPPGIEAQFPWSHVTQYFGQQPRGLLGEMSPLEHVGSAARQNKDKVKSNTVVKNIDVFV